MHWLEMIRVRASHGNESHAIGLLLDSSHRIAGEPGLVRTRVYSSASVGSDIALVLAWDTPEAPRSRSRVGLTVAQELKPFGLVDHSLWTERGGDA